MADPSPRHVGDVQQSVQSAQIDEGSEIGYVLHHSFPDLSREQFLDQRGPLLPSFALEDHAARHDDVATPLVELDDHEIVALAYQVLDVGNPPERDLGARKEGVDAHDVDGDAPLDLAGQKTLYGAVVLVGVPDQLPDPQEVGLLLGQDHHPVLVLEALEENVHLLARLDAVRILEFVQGNGALALEAELEDDRGLGCPQNPGLDDLSFADIAAGGSMLVEHGLEVVPRDVEDFFAVGIVEQFRRNVVRGEAPRGRGSGGRVRGVGRRLGVLGFVHLAHRQHAASAPGIAPAGREIAGEPG